MWQTILRVMLVCCAVSIISGCYNTPVRHLAADVGLVKVGSSSKEDVLVFLGYPDREFERESGNIVWLYFEEKESVSKRLPLVGEKVGSTEITQVAILFSGDFVSKVDFSVYDPDDLSWQRNFSWQNE